MPIRDVNGHALDRAWHLIQTRLLFRNIHSRRPAPAIRAVPRILNKVPASFFYELLEIRFHIFRQIGIADF